MQDDANGLSATSRALSLLAEIIADHGQVLIHLSGGCCDGSTPMCYARGEMVIGDNDVLLGHVGDTPVYVAASLAHIWQRSRLTLDAGPGRGGMFSLDGGRGRRFLVRSEISCL